MGLIQGHSKSGLRVAAGLLTVGLILVMLSGCSRSPCSRYLHDRFMRKPETVQQIPKPLSALQRRLYDLCVLRRHDVQIIRMGQTWKLVFPSDELFDNDTAEMNDSYKPILAVAADLMKTYSKIAVRVEGFTNRDHGEFITKDGGYTSELTRMQAEEVARFLTHEKINARLIYSVGTGGLHPVAWIGTTTGHRLNRRLEITFRYYRDNTAWY